MKRIAVLTSGGDAPGMNAAIRAAVRYGIAEGLEVFGIQRGYAGLIENEIIPMNMRSVSDIVQRGGTVLRTARSREFMTEEGLETAVENLASFGIEGLVVIGGDGSFRGAGNLSAKGIRTIGIPGTIDNDLGYTDFTLGFDTACNTILDAINKLRDTMSSHDRICIIEVMGRNCGDLALYAGIGGGAELIIVPEIKMGIDDIVSELDSYRKKGKYSSIIVLSEGAGKAPRLREQIIDRLGASVRATVLGHLQRGGSPSCRDRMLGADFGVKAVQLLKADIGNRVVGIKDGKVFDMDIAEGIAVKKVFDVELYNMAAKINNSTL